MQKLNIHYFQHVPFEGLGSIEVWAIQNGHHLSSTRFWESDELPKLKEIDWLIIMGGPMGVFDTDEFPWLIKEKDYIRKAIDNNKTVIGICLGSQLIADVLEAKVYRNQHKEIGWFPIHFSKNTGQFELFKNWKGSMPVFHWHGDTFELPEKVVHLAASEACKNQAFIYNQRVIGLQFHIETTKSSLEYMLTGSDDELIKNQYIQTPQEIKQGDHFIQDNQNMLFKLLTDLSL